MLDVSVIIPTYNRNKLLIKCLKTLENQNYDKSKFEVIVVDDGSNDGTKEAVIAFSKRTKLNLGFFSQNHKGPGAARNLAISKSKGRYIFITNDDTYPSRKWISEHMKTHNKIKGVAVLGFVDWTPGIKINAFMRFIAPYGPLFDFRIKDPNNCGFDHFFTSNISLDKKWLKNDSFNETFKHASCEDIELGCRLEKIGLKIIFNKNAVVYHDHYHEDVRNGGFYKKLYVTAKYFRIFTKFHPDIKKFKFDILAFFKLLASRLYFLFFFNKKLYWKLKCSFFYHMGMLDGYRSSNLFLEIIFKILQFSYYGNFISTPEN